MLIKDWILCLICVAAMVFLFCSCEWKAAKYSNKWRILFLLPAITCILHFILLGEEWCLLGIYLGGWIAGIGFFTVKASVRRRSLVTAMVLCCLSVPVCYCSDSYRKPNYVADFEQGFECMQEHYSLTEYKEVNWEGLYEEYLPLFEKAEKEHDEVANCIAWNAFCNEFYDAHTGYAPNGDVEAMTQSVCERVMGNDYGLATICLTSGEYVAVLIEENSPAYKAGIRTGTVITEWNGKAPKEWQELCSKRMEQCMICGNRENQRFYEGCFLGGIGDEQVTVAYINEMGGEETVTLDAVGSYYERFEKMACLLTYKEPKANLSVVELDKDTVLLNVNMMQFDSESMNSSDYSSVQATIREQLIPYREQGVTNLIIDLRNNGGGSTKMAQAIVSLVAEGEHFWAADGAYQEATGEYEVLNSYTYTGENLWQDGEIVVLVNSGSNSAANHCMSALQQLEHVTVIGLSEPAGAAQGVVGERLEGGWLNFSGTLVLDEAGDIWIDSDATGEPRLLVDERVPLDERAIKEIFENGEDYVLNYALEYLEQTK